jgi:ATP-dependent Zn protease
MNIEKIFEYRLAMRLKIITRPFNLITIASILPFFLGFFDFLNQNQQLKKTLFEKNIPGLTIPTESVNWDTFRYFTETKKDFLIGLEKIELSPNSIFLTKTIDEKHKLASIKTKNFGYFLENLYLNLDELPLKIDNLNSYSKFALAKTNNSIISNSIGDFSLESFDEPLVFNKTNSNIEEEIVFLPFHDILWTKNSMLNFSGNNKENLLTLNNDFSSFSNSKSYYISIFEQSFISNKQKPAMSDLTTSKNGKNHSVSCVEKQTSFLLNKALKNSKIYGISIFGKQNTINSVEGLIKNLDQVLVEQGFSSNRRMSGFEYPDMNSKKVNHLLLQNGFSLFPNNVLIDQKNKKSLKIVFPANPVFIKQYPFVYPQISKFHIETGFVNLQDFDSKQTLYSRRAPVLNKNKGLDWKTTNSSKFSSSTELKINSKSGSSQRQNLRFWLQNYLSPVNPLTHSKDTILGLTIQSRSDFLFSQKKKHLMIPFLTENQWEKIYTENKNKIESKRYLNDFCVNKIPLPFVEIYTLKQKHVNLDFTLNPTIDYFYSPYFTKPFSFVSVFDEIKTEKFTGNPLSLNFFNENLNRIQYKKLKSIFHQPLISEISFLENWERLTFNSWLIVSQIGVAFLFFNFLKYLITDYFNELLWFIIDIGFAVGLIDENLKEEIELLTGQRDKGYRILATTKRKFQDIAGIKNLLPEIAEIVWFLRNSGKEFSVSKNIPRGLLLIGPPGTGKTVLVQALAGEAKVPVLTLSGSSLLAPGESGALKLEFLFEEARHLAPCIVFIDEIDTLAEKRKGVMQNPMGGDEIFSALEPVSPLLDTAQSMNSDFLTHSQTSFFKKTNQILSILSQEKRSGDEIKTPSSIQLALEIKQKMHAQEKSQQEQLTLLIQLLIELDGIQGRKGVVVIGATNRPEMIDSAILRPGRFDKILELGLPNHEKRLEIFKLYGDILGCLPNISWEYLSKRTVGYTAADIASIMNQSCLKAILLQGDKAKHDLTTIEHGIDRITTYEIEKPPNKVTNIFKYRLAYYQAGKIVLSTILEYHPPTLVSYLWPRRQNRRSLQISINLQKYFFQFARRCELEDRIIGCYAGKAAEILFLQNLTFNLSNFGLEDLSFAFILICFTIEKWYIYSKSTIISKLTQIIENKNAQEYIPEKLEFFRELAASRELPPHWLYSGEDTISSHASSKNFFSTAWWQFYVCQELEFVERNFADWYRLYLPNPEETKLNIEWSPPDEFYHSNLLNKQVTKNTSVPWNNLHNIARDYQVHSFVLASFNKALFILDQNREFLDKLVFELVTREVLRESEIEKLSSFFISIDKKQEPSNQKIQNHNISPIKIVNNSFGKMSRRKIKNWIDFKDFES